MIVGTRNGFKRTAIMIPSKGRPTYLSRILKRSPFLDDPDVYVGIDFREKEDYASFFNTYSRITAVEFDNEIGSVGLCRQRLLERVRIAKHKYSYLVFTDDNARYDQSAIRSLVRCCAEWHTQPCFVAGMHRVRKHFDRDLITKTTETVHGVSSYPMVSMILYCTPYWCTEGYTCPDEMYALEDRHMIMWLMEHHGFRQFRICLDSEFTKPRYQKGGQGNLEARAWKCGRAIELLARDFPAMCGSYGTLRIPWTYILDRMRGGHATRLAGGSTLSDHQLTKSKLTIRKK